MFVKTQIFKAISFRNPIKLPVSYWVLVIFRFILTLLPQQGYIHPDEFFQNVEIIAGDIFAIDVARTWEFNPKFPIRNIFVPKLVLGPPLHFIRLMYPLAKQYFNIDLKTTYFLLVIPRIFICLLSLINDYCLYKICVLYGQNVRNRLKIFASSYVVIVYCCRSFSNSFEMIYFSILLLIVSECMYKSDKIIYHDEYIRERYNQAKSPLEKVKIYKLQTHLPDHSLSKVHLVAAVVAVGIFNRPTFIGFAFPPLFFWLHRGLGSKVVGFKDFHYRILVLILSGLPIVCLLIIIDSAYYGYLTIPDIESMKVTWDNWVVTPLNFLRYNSDKRNLTQHGLHPRWLHLAVNIPLLFNILGIIAFITLGSNILRFSRGQYSKLPRVQSITGLMMFSLVAPITLLSLFPHQEARFIIPVLIPLVFLFGNHLYSNDGDSSIYRRLKLVLRYTWYVSNIFLTIFFGFVHQGGIYPFANNLHSEIKNNYGVHFHVMTSHSYSIPTYLLQIESTTKIWQDRKTSHKYRIAPSTFIRRYGSLPMKDLFTIIDSTLTDAEMMLHGHKKQYRFYMALPCSLEQQFEEVANRDYPYIDIFDQHSYYPHFTSEAIPTFPSQKDKSCFSHSIRSKLNESHIVDLTLFERMSCFIRQFCLRIYRIKPSNKFKI